MIKAVTVKEVKKAIKKVKQKGLRLGFVPTMGALHAGHCSLLRRARRESDFLAASIFVNPLQFDDAGDLKRYPRTLASDISRLRKEGVDLLFCPSLKEMYSTNYSLRISELFLSQVLCGGSRQGHFDGVCAVVAKLFNIVQPDAAYFGQKDYQQAMIVKRLARDLNFPVSIKILPIVREKDKLAMSSRNSRLSVQERKDSLCLYESLRQARDMVMGGECRSKAVIERIKEIILARHSIIIDYIEVIDPITLRSLELIDGKALVALAVNIGGNRLIDNMFIYGKK